MSWEIVVLIVVVLGAGVGVEYWRVPRVRAWAVRRGFDVETPPAPDLEAVVTSDAQLVEDRPNWGIGLVMTRAGIGGQIRISEQKLRLLRGGSQWFTVVAIESEAPLAGERASAALHPPGSGTEVAVDGHRLVVRRRGLIWPWRLDPLVAEAERQRDAVRGA